jgi:hypothetical protein
LEEKRLQPPERGMAGEEDGICRHHCRKKKHSPKTIMKRYETMQSPKQTNKQTNPQSQPFRKPVTVI